MRQKLIIFVKAPRPGFVKTRLAQTLGAEAACAVYVQLVLSTLHRLQTLQNVELRFTPDDAAAEVAPWLRSPWTATPQGRGDLGVRLSRAFGDAFAAGYEYVSVVGSDCPAIAASDVLDSWNLLAHNDAVIGPASDGGYWLIALKAPAPDLFAKIDWSTPRVLEQTVAKVTRTNRSCYLLRQLTDIDTVDDWNRFMAENQLVSQS